VIRAQATGQKYKAYSFQLVAPTSKSRPSSDGLQYHFEFLHEAGQKKDGTKPVTRRHIMVQFDRIIEFMDNEGSGMRDELVRRIDATTKQDSPGITCDAAKATAAAQPGKSCVLQDFFLDRFEVAKYTDTGAYKITAFNADVQGTSPWCSRGKRNPECLKAPTSKPRVRFEFVFDEKKGGAVSFGQTNAQVYVANFPVTFKNSTLALSFQVHALEMSATLSQDDKTPAAASTDFMDCDMQPVPSGCPRVKINNHVDMTWGKYVSSVGNSSTKFKVVTSTSQQVPPPGHKDRLGTVLPVQRNYFSFKHDRSIGQKWKLAFGVGDLVETMHSSTGIVVPSLASWVLWAVCACAAACAAT